jgi:hypothetical protein
MLWRRYGMVVWVCILYFCTGLRVLRRLLVVVVFGRLVARRVGAYTLFDWNELYCLKNCYALCNLGVVHESLWATEVGLKYSVGLI